MAKYTKQNSTRSVKNEKWMEKKRREKERRRRNWNYISQIVSPFRLILPHNNEISILIFQQECHIHGHQVNYFEYCNKNTNYVEKKNWWWAERICIFHQNWRSFFWKKGEIKTCCCCKWKKKMKHFPISKIIRQSFKHRKIEFTQQQKQQRKNGLRNFRKLPIVKYSKQNEKACFRIEKSNIEYNRRNVYKEVICLLASCDKWLEFFFLFCRI